MLKSFTAQNHLDPTGPFYSGHFAVEEPQPGASLSVISYNIAYGKRIEQAHRVIQEFSQHRELDLLLLQEMEEVGVEKLARALQLNFMYYPAAIEPKYGRNFGNAVLSRWPILQAHKLLLPHTSFSDRMKRIATRATVRMGDMDIVAYSIHTEPVFILPKHKQEQCLAILGDPGSQAAHVIAGGDFNSFTGCYVEMIERRFRQAGFVRASKGSGPTFARFGMKMTTDQIFAKGFAVEAAGKLSEAKASDHLPIWVSLAINKV